jgi:hypothetical protein
MRSRELNLSRYDTDKVANGYLEHYDPILAPLVKEDIKLLEIGIYNGGSLLLWQDYFPKGTIVGIDRTLPPDVGRGERIEVFQGSQDDVRFLSEVAAKTAPAGYDVIIDDASHIGKPTRTAFWHLFDNHLRAGGIYVIEDWGTGYWDDWPDGKSAGAGDTILSRVASLFSFRQQRSKVPWLCHSHGMVGFVKELIDEQGAKDLTRRNLRGTPGRESKFESMLIAHGLVIVKKARKAGHARYSPRELRKT